MKHYLTIQVFVGEDPAENKWGVPSCLPHALIASGDVTPEQLATPESAMQAIGGVLMAKGNFYLMSKLTQYLGAKGYTQEVATTIVKADLLLVAQFVKDVPEGSNVFSDLPLD